MTSESVEEKRNKQTKKRNAGTVKGKSNKIKIKINDWFSSFP